MRRLSCLALVALALPSAGSAAFPGTNGRLLFTQERSRFERSAAPLVYVCAATPAGSRPSQLPLGQGDSVEHPDVSADGTLLAYAADGSVYSSAIDGSAARLLGPGQSPAWAPDSRRIVYEHLGDIHLVRADGTGDTVLTAGAPWDAMPAVSPDGTTVAFVRGRRPTGEELVVRSIADGTERVLLATPLLSGPAWSPDGRRLAVVVGGSLATLSAAGGDLRTILQGAAADPAYSPDGTRIAFELGGDIWTSAADGSDLVNVTRSPPRERQPAWQNGAAPTAAGSDRPVRSWARTARTSSSAATPPIRSTTSAATTRFAGSAATTSSPQARA